MLLFALVHLRFLFVEETRLCQQIEFALNRDQSNLIEAVNQFKYEASSECLVRQSFCSSEFG